MRDGTLVQYTIILTVEVVFILHRVADASIYSLFPYLGLSHGLWNRLATWSCISTYQVVNSSHARTLGLVEILVSHHHLLLSCIRRFSCLITTHCKDRISIWVSGASSVVIVLVSNISVRWICFKLIKGIVLSWLSMWLVGSWFGDECSVEHGLSHLLLLRLLALSAIDAKTTNSGLVKHLLLLLFGNIWEHFMDSRIVSRL